MTPPKPLVAARLEQSEGEFGVQRPRLISGM